MGTSINAICATIEIKGLVDVDAVQKSLSLAVEHDPSLRTRITLEDGAPRQYVAEYEAERYPVYDFSMTDREGVAHWEQAITRQPMPLVDAPLCRFYIFRRNETEGGVLVKTHHIISDGWSQVLLSNRIADTYLALLSGRQPDLVDAPCYQTHVEKEGAYLSSKAHQRDRLFWAERMEEFQGPASVKECDAAAVSPVGRRKTYRLSHVLNHAIHDFCERSRVSPFALFYMALAVYLSRTGGGGAGIGVPVFNRGDFIDKQTTGMYVSTLPFFMEVNEAWSLNRFNSALAEKWLELLRCQRLPYSEIAALAKEKHPGAESLFHVVLSYQTSRIYESADASVIFSGRWHYSGYQNEHLLIHLSSMQDDFRYSVDYDYLTQIFSEQEIDQLHQYLTNILTEALANPEKPLWQLSILGEAEKEKVLFAFNQTARPLKHPSPGEMLLQTTQRNAGRVAVIAGGKRLTYGALMERAGALARAMEELAATEGEAHQGDNPHGEASPIAICLPKGFALAEFLCAALLSNRPYVMLPVDTPAGRRREILADCGATVLATSAQTARELGLAEDGIPLLLEENAVSAGGAYAPPPAKGEELAYLVYTSGSTGKPKGVEIQGKSLVNLACAIRGLYGHGAVLSLCSTGFDVFVMESAAALMNGRTVVFPVEGEQESPRALAGLIQSYAVGNLTLPPSRLKAYLREPEFARALSQVESIVCGGERFPPSLLHTLKQLTRARIYNQYGPSEACVAVSARLLNDAPALTIGKPMENCRLYVLDGHRMPLPIGVYGQVYIGGLCVGRGYRGLPERTQEAFFPSPFEPGERLYRTGDIGCWTAEGEIMLRGREDSQIKLRGLRIEPQEIAMRLMNYEKISSAVVTAVGEGDAKYLAAYYTSPEPIEEAELFAYAQTYLPGYMLPAWLCRVERIPLTANGKIDYPALPAPERAQGGEAESEPERQVLLLLRGVLGRPDIGVNDDYFLFGGDSLNAMEALTRAEEQFGARLRVADLYACRTARRLTARLLAQKGEGRRERPGEEIPKTDAEWVPLTPSQRGIYLESGLDPTGVAYHMPGAFSLGAEVDEHKLEEAFRALIRGERLLRTGFEFGPQGLCQHVHGQADFSLEHIQAQGFQQAASAFLRPFPLDRPPLMRAALWREETGQRYLFFDCHHLIGDGLSSPLLMKRLDGLYRGESPARPPVDFLDYAMWRASNANANSNEHEAYWKKQLKDCPSPLDLPLDGQRPKAFDYRGETVSFPADGALSAACVDFCAKEGISPAMLFAGALALLMGRLGNTEDVVLGTPVSARTSPALWQTPGPLIQTLPLRLKGKRDMPVGEYLRGVKETLLGLLDHAECPLEQALAAGGLSGAPYRCIFSMRPVEEGDFTLLGETVSPIPMDTHTAKAEVYLEASKAQGGFRFALTYASTLFSSETAALWARSYLAVLSGLIGEQSRAVGEISSVSAQDKRALFDKPDRLRTPFVNEPLDHTILEMAAAAPLAPAIRFHGETTTYGVLARESERIARGLAALGARPGDAVAVIHGRSPGLLACYLGILRAGCVYVPILPAYPAERIKYMLTAASARFALADEQTVGVLAKESLPCPVLFEGAIAPAPDAPLPDLANRSGEDGAYVLFTSGTTGKPKGALNTHGAIANLLLAMTPILEQGGERVLFSTNIVFDISLTETMLALALGKCVVMADEEEMQLPWKLGALIEEENITTAQFTPSRLQMCLGNREFAHAAARLKAMLLVGEPLTLSLVAQWRSACESPLYNLYGPTEAAVYVSVEESSRAEKRVLIGKPFPNCRIYVLEDGQKRAMPTARGELYLAGQCVAAGYVNAPEQTNQAFLPDPFFPGERMYKTGDMGRLLPDGRLEFLGRVDSQIKINGQRVEPDEVSSLLGALDGVTEAVAFPITRENGSKALKAAVVPAQGQRLEEGALKAALGRELPAYMIPDNILILPALPRSPAGKVNTLALTAMGDGECRAAWQGAKGPQANRLTLAQEEPQTKRSADSPTPIREELQTQTQADRPEADSPTPMREELQTQTKAEGPPAKTEADRPGGEALEGVWKEVLCLEEIDEEASFFQQGGSSLSALNLISRCYNLGWKESISDFYADPTLRGQRERLLGQKGGHASAPGEALSSMEAEGPESLQTGTGTKDSMAPQTKTEAQRPEAEGPKADRLMLTQEEPQTKTEAERPKADRPEAERPKAKSLGGVLITGATGYFGAHLVKELADAGRKVFCLVRGGQGRLYAALCGYFGADWMERVAGQVQAVTGDVMLKDLGLDEHTLGVLRPEVSTLIHAAADVRHYVENESASLGVNAGGAANAVNAARALGARLCHVSTTSVCAGMPPTGEMPRFTEENTVDWRQPAPGVYIKGKRMAEAFVLNAARTGLDAHIYRVGRLVTSRRDGRFQRCGQMNAFRSFLQAAAELELLPEGTQSIPVEMTPVDDCARAMALLLEGEKRVYHLFNPQMVEFGRIAAALGKGQEAFVRRERFNRYLMEVAVVRPGVQLAMLTDAWMSLNAGAPVVAADCARTAEDLARLSFAWEMPDVDQTVAAMLKND